MSSLRILEELEAGNWILMSEVGLVSGSDFLLVKSINRSPTYLGFTYRHLSDHPSAPDTQYGIPRSMFDAAGHTKHLDIAVIPERAVIDYVDRLVMNIKGANNVRAEKECPQRSTKDC